MKLFLYSVEMSQNLMPNWTVELPSLAKNTTDINLGAKMIQDLNYFIFQDNLTVSRSVKRLELEGLIVSREDYEVRVNLLRTFAPGLQKLNWGGILNLDLSSEQGYQFPEDVQFHKLAVFTLSMAPLVESGVDEYIYPEDCSSLEWLLVLIKSWKSLPTLRLECCAALSLQFLEMFHLSGARMLSCLRELSLNTVTLDVLKALVKLNISLKKLELFSLDLTKQDFPYADKLLQKHCQTLHSLLFIIPLSPRRRRHSSSVYYFPEIC